MADTHNSEKGFLGRWSARKVAVKEGKSVAEPLPQQRFDKVNPNGSANMPSTASVEAEPVEPPPALTLDDVAVLTPASDFSTFVAKGVDTVVKNAAMKKLFADPHYNIMDGLDIYIDDYSKEDPLPPGMLEMMRQSDMLGLFKKVLDEPVLSVAANNAPELESFVVQEKTSSIEDHSIKDPLLLEPQSLEEDNTLVQHQTGGTDQNTIPLNPIAGKAP